MPDEDLYELVQMDPLHKLRERGEELEKEIDSIKKVLKDTVAVSKLHASADELVDKIIEMIKVSQDMVEAVAKTNQQLSQQLQKSLDEMVRSNKELSEKLDGLLDFFAEASEAPPEEESAAAESELKPVLENLTRKLDEVVQTNREVATRTAELQSGLSNITGDIQTQVKKMRAPGAPVPQQQFAPTRLTAPRPGFPSAPLPPAPIRAKQEDL